MLHFNKLTDFLPSTTGQFQHSLFGRNCVAAGAIMWQLCGGGGELCGNCVAAGANYVAIVWRRGRIMWQLCGGGGELCGNCVAAGAIM